MSSDDGAEEKGPEVSKKQATFRFYAELNDFLPEDRRQRSFVHAFWGSPSVKDTIEALGVPHTEVDLITVNGELVDFTYQVGGGDQVSVYPVFESLDISPVARLRPEPLRRVRFVLDTHLGRLATYLRMLGFDCLYQNDYEDETLASISAEERRILLTKDRGLLKRSVVSHGYFVRETQPRAQLLEVLRRFDLFSRASAFRRCLRCNQELVEAPKGEVMEDLPERVRQEFNEFRRCPGCGRVYWRGSHYQRMLAFTESVLQEGR